MISFPNYEKVLHYQVQVGHAVVRVQSRNPEEAIEMAKERFCDDFPRLWDIIATLADDRFIVAPVNP